MGILLLTMATASPSADLLTFVCAYCDTCLTIPGEQAGVSGPCPQCGEPITSPVAVEVETSLETVRKAMGAEPETVVQKVTPPAPTVAAEETAQAIPPQMPAAANTVWEVEPVDPKSGLTQNERERREFQQVVKLVILTLVTVVVAAVAVHFFQDQIWALIESKLS